MYHLRRLLLFLDKSFELNSLYTDERISKDGGYVSNSASVWDRSDSKEFTISSFPSYVKSPRDKYCHRDQQEMESDKSESKTFRHNKQQLATNEISGTCDPIVNVLMSSDYVPCKALECNSNDHRRLNKDLKNDLQNKINNNTLDRNVEGNSNSGGYVSHSSALDFPVK